MADVIHNPLPSFTSTSSEAPTSAGILGREFAADNGKVYRFVQAAAGAVSAKFAVQVDASGGNEYEVEHCSAGNPPMGVAAAAIASGSYGFVQIAGIASVLTACSGGAATANTLVKVAGSAGKIQPVATAATGNAAADLLSALGVSIEAKTANQSANIYLRGLR